MPNAGPEPLIARFRDDVLRLIDGEREEGGCLLALAVSGGPDSMALLWLALMAFPRKICAATVDHQLRREAREEAAMVARWCADHEVPHAILTPEQPIEGSIQASARTARYALLHRWREEQGARWLLTAHHADDQRETVLMRLNRSSGVGGLAGIRARNGAVLRPLLGWRRAELAQITSEHGIPHVLDPSNADDRFDRVAMRNRLVDVEWIDALAISRSAAACADAEEALIWTVDGIADRHISDSTGTITLDRTNFPTEILRRLVHKMLLMADGAGCPPRGEALDRALTALRAGKKISIGNCLLSGGPIWTAKRAPPRNN